MARIIILFLILIFGIHPVFADTATVTDVFDGDSLNVEVKGQKIRVTLYGIDAPESGQDGNTSATRFMRHLVLHRSVVLTVMGQDVFGRTQAIITPTGQTFSANDSIVANGYAWVNPFDCKATACIQMKELESRAKKLRLGIWSGYDLVSPWEFRKQRKR